MGSRYSHGLWERLGVHGRGFVSSEMSHTPWLFRVSHSMDPLPVRISVWWFILIQRHIGQLVEQLCR